MPYNEFLKPLRHNFLQSHFIIISLLSIGIISLLIRIVNLPFGTPLNADAFFYFLYSTEINFLGYLPTNWTPLNNGWPVFNSIIFSLFPFDNPIRFMDLQRLISVSFSVLTIFPVFVICKKFVSSKFALLGAAIFGFDPRLVVNSIIGVTDPLYIFLGTFGLALFLQKEKKLLYLSFVFVGLATLVRGEGLFLFLALSIMFIIKFRREKTFLASKFPMVVILFLLIVIPMSLYRIDVDGNDGIFLRTTSSLENISGEISSDGGRSFGTFLAETFELFFKYLAWVHIPIFIFFTPIGAVLMFQKRTFNKNTILISMGIMSLPALVAYSVPAFDTRYLYILFPMFCVLSVLSIQKFLWNIEKQNLILFLIISIIFIVSIPFFDYLNIDYTHEQEAYSISKYIVANTSGVNSYSKSNYIVIAQTPNQWPFLSSEFESNISIIQTDDFSSLDELLSVAKTNNVSHIVVDDSLDENSYLFDLYINESSYPYIEKIYDSHTHGFDYHVKIFRINYEKFDNII